jgi:hypothetical protein
MRARVCCRGRGRTKDRDIKALPIEKHGDTDAILSMTQARSLQQNICRDLNRRNRGNVPNKAKRSTRPGVRPMITTNLLAANIEYQTSE